MMLIYSKCHVYNLKNQNTRGIVTFFQLTLKGCLFLQNYNINIHFNTVEIIFQSFTTKTVLEFYSFF